MDTEPISADVMDPQQPAAGPALIVPKTGKGKLLTGGKPGPRGPYNKAAKNKVLRDITAELLAQIQRGIAKDKQLGQMMAAGNPRALETGTRIFESVHDRAYGKPVLANHLAAEGDEGSTGQRGTIVQIGSVSITF